MHFIIGRDGGPTPDPDRATLEQEVGEIVRTWTDGFADALAGAYEPGRADALLARYRQRVLRRLSRRLSAAEAVDDIRDHRDAVAGAAARRRVLSAQRGRQALRRAQGLEPSTADPAVGARAGAGKHGLPGRRRAHLRGRQGRERCRFLAARHGAGARRRRGASISASSKARAGDELHRRDARRRRERRLQRAGDGGGLGWRDVALRSHRLALPAPDPRALFAGLHVGDAAQARARSRTRSSSCSTRGSIRAAKPTRARQDADGDRRRDRRRRWPRSTASTRTASCGASSTRCSRRSAPTTISSARTASRKQEISIKFASRKLDGVPKPRAALRNLRLFAARRRRAHALRQGGARRHPLVGPAAGFPHRNSRPGEGAAGQERGDRAGRLQGRLRAQAPAGGRHARGDRRPRASRPTSCSSQSLLDITDNLDRKGVVPPENVVRHDDDDPYLVVAADKGTATFSDIANGISRSARLLARRCVRLRRLGRLRPQGHGHHGARRLGGGEAPLPRDGRRHHDDAVHRGRRRRHVGRRVRQRHAAREDDEAARGVRPPRHLHRSRSRSGEKLRRAGAAVRAAAVELAGLRQEADLQGRRHLPALAEGDRAVEGGAGRDRPRQGQGDAGRDDERDPEGAGRSVVLRRHRHLHPRLDRDRRGGRRPRQRSDPHHRHAGSRQGDRRGRQSRHDPARPDRGGAERRAAQHRRDRQLGRRQHLRRRGQHQDRAEPAGARRAADAQDAQHAARQDDRRGRGAGAAQQLSADAGAVARAAARAGRPGLPAAADADAGAAGRARPRGRVPAGRHGDRRATSAASSR